MLLAMFYFREIYVFHTHVHPMHYVGQSLTHQHIEAVNSYLCGICLRKWTVWMLIIWRWVHCTDVPISLSTWYRSALLTHIEVYREVFLEILSLNIPFVTNVNYLTMYVRQLISMLLMKSYLGTQHQENDMTKLRRYHGLPTMHCSQLDILYRFGSLVMKDTLVHFK